MGPFGTVPEEPRDRPVIKSQWGDEQLFMVVDEFFLSRFDKPVQLSIHVVSLGYVCQRFCSALIFLEVLHELRAVVGKTD